MKALVIVAHPCDDSFCHAAARRAIIGLETAGHDVDVIDLYACGFRAAMSYEERMAYETDNPVLDPQVAEHIALLKAARTVVFVYPTWWSSVPAILKGWLERVTVPGVGFTFDERTGKVKPGLMHIKRIVGISTYGSPQLAVRLVHDNGRRIISRSLRVATKYRARTTWLPLYGMDNTTHEERGAFLARVEARMAGV